MKITTRLCLGLSIATASIFCLPCSAQESGIVKPQTLVDQTVEGMPKGEKQEVRVLTASFRPGDRTVFHTHRFPVTVYVLEGAFTLEMEGMAPVKVSQGEAMMEPPHVRMTGYNRSNSDPLRVVVFYVSDPDTPFFDPLH
ncbi:cupin domain-containing protein [Paraburkholderia sediminicola]|uniref:cupin domain-containing protein n=1 Tax=Paraburkholderia sediminicola TaxID=458836 RepID=UPI0038BB4F7E